MPALHVSLVCSAHPPGDTRILTRWVSGLSSAGIKASLIAPRIEPIPEMPQGVEIILVEPFTRYADRLRHSSRVLKPLRQLSPDIVIYPDPELHAPLLRYRSHSECAVVFDRHENFDQPDTLYQGTGVTGRLVAQVYPRIEAYACRRLDGVIVVIPSMLDILPPGTNAVVAHNFPTRAVLNDLAGEADAGTKTFAAINLGAIQANRGFQHYLELARCLVIDRGRSDFSLCLGGKWDPGALEWATHYAEQHKIVDHVMLVPARIPHSEAIQLTKAAKIGFSPYLDNAKAHRQLQNKVLEFMAAGLPVITSPSSLNRELVETAGCGVLHWANEVEQIADTIETWLDNPDLAAELGRRGQTYVRENLVWESELARVLPWLDQLAAARRRR